MSRPSDIWPPSDPSTWINVKAHGAVGNGRTDDLPAIMRAIAALPSSDGVLLFPQPEIAYMTSGPVYVRDRTRFTILGHGATIRIQDRTPYEHDLDDYPNAYDGGDKPRQFSVLEIFNCSDWELAGLVLDGNYRGRGPSDREHSHGIHVAGCHRFSVRSVELQYCQGDGIMLTYINADEFGDVARTSASNCSEFALLDIYAHNIARNSISLVGARDGVVDRLIDSDIGTDLDNSAKGGPWSGLHFEVDHAEAEEVAEHIRATNLTMRRHRPNGPNQANGGAIRFSNRSQHCTVTNFRYEQDEPNTHDQYIIAVGPNSSNITLSGGVVEVKNAHYRQGEPNKPGAAVYGVFLQQQSPTGEAPHGVTIEDVTLDGPSIGIRVSQGCTAVRIARNVIRNCQRTGLWLQGECHVSENLLQDMGLGWWFVEAQACLPGAVATVEGNVLANTFPPSASASFYFLTTPGSCLIAKKNRCYGLAGAEQNRFGGDPISFLENRFGGNDYGLTGVFTWPAGHERVSVPNTNVTSYTPVVIFPVDGPAEELDQAGISVSATNPHESFTVTTKVGGTGPASDATFAYQLF